MAFPPSGSPRTAYQLTVRGTASGLTASPACAPTASKRGYFSTSFVGSAPLGLLRPTALAWDAAQNIFYVREVEVEVEIGDDDMTLIATIDPVTQDDAVRSDDSQFDRLDDPYDMVLDGDRLLVLDYEMEGVYAVATQTGERTIVSGTDMDVGTGPEFREPVSLAVDRAGDRIFVADEFDPVLFAVNPGTGDRTVIASSSVGSGPGPFSTPVWVEFDAMGNRALVLSHSLDPVLAIDPGTGNRTVVSPPAAPRSPSPPSRPSTPRAIAD